MTFGLSNIANESDVEQKIIYPFLALPQFLGISSELIKTKDYLAPTLLDKSAGKKYGYYPDYSVWVLGHPILIVEAKDPSVPAQVGFREACLYARHLNSQYPANFNPCKFVISCNGKEYLAGYWDQAQPVLELKVSDLNLGTKACSDALSFSNFDVLRAHAETYFDKVNIARGIRPYTLAGGQPLLNAKEPLNTFAADLSPVLRRYFSSTNHDNVKEIAERAYVSSAEITEYDRVLEALLKDRVVPRRDTIVQQLRTSKREEPLLTKAIQGFKGSRSIAGQLQIIQGGVGSGKSLFARRYHELLEPEDLKSENFWAFVDFNASPASLKDSEKWLCESFLESFERENQKLNIYETSVLRGIFSKKIQQRKSYYEQLRTISVDEETRARATDIAEWQSDYVDLTEGLSNYILKVIKKNLIVVMDNVDKLDLDNQLYAFQTSLWFMDRTKAFIILQMRDETYERYKNKPPLDTFRAGIAFHIAPPRFIDVVKRRLDLAIEYLAENAAERQEYISDNGIKIFLPKGELGNFLKVLYAFIFGRRGNVSRVLEALAGRDVRKALEMFVSIITSGHLSSSAITSNVVGGGGIPINEYHILRILMRTDYRFFSDNSGYISNIFHYENEWKKADNFLLAEILYFLSMNRKRSGELGLEGYFSVERICDELQKLGYDRDDVFKATNYLLDRQLIIADHFSFSKVEISDCVKIQASGFMHLRFLCCRMEYLFGVITVVPVASNVVASKLANYIERENHRGDIRAVEKITAIKILLGFLKGEMIRLREKNPFFNPEFSGAVYVIKSIEKVVDDFYGRNRDQQQSDDQLDSPLGH